MKRFYVLVLITLLGVGIAGIVIFNSNKPADVNTQGMPLFKPPYDSFVAGAGIVEATTGNISIGTPVSGVVMKIYVKVGDHVKLGEPLFKIDDRDLEAQLLTANARIGESISSLRAPRHQLKYMQDLKKRDPSSVDPRKMDLLRDEMDVAESGLTLAKAQLKQIKMEIERRTVRAPVAGSILQLKMRLGEYVEGSGNAQPLLLLGGDDRFNLRVDVDEQDAWRVQPGEEAIAFVRSNPKIKIPLRYEYTEPYVIPKTTLTGLSTERTDTRVLQVVYSFAHANYPVYLGQLLDVYIRAPKVNSSTARQ
jgi:RND family efflux transporter MFP subunit